MTGERPPAGHWISPRDITASASMRLFCLPHAGSGSAAYYRWRRQMPEGVELCPIFLPGREVRLSEPSFVDSEALLDELAAALEPHLDRPYAIFGHSMGALLAFELAHRVRALGLRQPGHLFLSGRIAPQLPPSSRKLHLLSDDHLIEELRLKYGGLPQALLEDPELRELFLPIVRADLTLVENYVYRERLPLDSAFTLFAGTEDQSVSAGKLAAWASQSTGSFALKMLPGDHFYHLGPSGAQVLAELTRTLTP